MNIRMQNESGVTLMELLIAVLITGIVSTAGFQFYGSVQNQSLVQQDVSDMQLSARASLDDITRTLRMAGYKLPTGHPPYKVSGDSLYVYYSGANPVDTVLYYLKPNTVLGEGAPKGWKPNYIMKKTNGGAAAIFNDVIRSVTFTKIDTATFEISVEAQTPKADNEVEANSGYRSFTSTERVTIRNLNL
jgi:prepilin-type N-terminal cleavage/methylation domain-containing protein